MCSKIKKNNSRKRITKTKKQKEKKCFQPEVLHHTQTHAFFIAIRLGYLLFFKICFSLFFRKTFAQIHWRIHIHRNGSNPQPKTKSEINIKSHNFSLICSVLALFFFILMFVLFIAFFSSFLAHRAGSADPILIHKQKYQNNIIVFTRYAISTFYCVCDLLVGSGLFPSFCITYNRRCVRCLWWISSMQNVNTNANGNRNRNENMNAIVSPCLFLYIDAWCRPFVWFFRYYYLCVFIRLSSFFFLWYTALNTQRLDERWREMKGKHTH